MNSTLGTLLVLGGLLSASFGAVVGIEGGLRHKADPEDVVQSACKSFFVRCDDGKPELIN